MLTRVISVALLGLLLVDVQCQATTWNSCSQSIVSSLQGLVDSIGKNQVIVQNMGICHNLTVNLQDLEAHPDCGVKNCDGNKMDCRELKLSFHIKNVKFVCEIEDAGGIMKELDPTLPAPNTKSELTTSGAWSELVISVTYQVTCAKETGIANVIQSTVQSKPGSLAMSCPKGAEPLKTTCNSLASREKLCKFTEKMLEEKAPEILKGISDNAANMNCL